MSASINPMDLTGQTVLVTGASSGIGRETAVLLSALGARVVAAARSSERLEQTLSLLEGSGHAAESVDLTDLDALPAWVKSVTGRVGPLSGVVHSAGVSDVRPVRTVDAGHMRSMLDLNLGAGLMLARGFRQKGCHAERGSLVLISSVAGMQGESGMTVYSASKAALFGLARSLALELVKDGIRVNCVSPGLVATEMASRHEMYGGSDQVANAHPLGIGHPRDVANAVGFLLSDASRWITGSNMVVDGGYTA